MSVALALGNTALLARGDLLPLLTPIGSAILLASAILSIAGSLLSTMPGQVTTTQEIAVVALAAVTGATVAALSADPAALLPTVLVTVGLTTTLSGATMFALGAFRLGRITRYVPYPVFAGFLAITGWYLITGGMETIIGGHLGLHRLPEFADPNTSLKVGLAIGFVVVVLLANWRWRSGVALPVAALAAIIAFNIGTAAAGLSQSELESLGWLAVVPATGLGWPPVGIDQLAAVDWSAVGAGLVFAPFAVIITTAGAMMNVSGIELDTRADVDLNLELRSMGTGNILAGLVGGIPGFPAVSTSLLAQRLGAWHRATGVIAGLVAFAALAFAPLIFSRVPVPMLGALLIWIGVSLTMDWLLRPIGTMRRSEYAIILVILGVSIAAGLPAGIAMGLLAALVLFVVEYARVDGVRFIASGRDYHSRAVTQQRRSELAGRGDAIAVIKLAGFIFFGTSDRIVQRIVARSRTSDGDKWFAILDFRRVTGFDSSTVLSFERLRRVAERDGFRVVFASLGPLVDRLSDGGLDVRSAPFHLADDLEAALRWAENDLIGAAEAQTGTVPAATSLGELLGDNILAEAMFPYLERHEYRAGERLILQGTEANDILVVEAGDGEVILETRDGSPVVVLMDFVSGTILGEVAFYGNEPRSASVLARTDVVAFKLSREALTRIERDRPEAAAAFHRALARVLAQRLQSANRLINVLAG